ncbi:MAG: DUF1636 family protein [Nostoc sp.]|uniref:DUF1636 family protein n=1 Tax=unclassified Nostoc TaxID=2593658 RepID=UPI001DFBEF99|nr:DUF1636 family protein [Nostoc sp. JL34]MBN3884978.1 DUF1636 family protein [Nostoc sp. JL34]
MTKHTLLVCKSCHRSSEERPENPPFDGATLIDRLNTLCVEQFPSDEIKIQPVGCLWACSKGCVVSVSSHNKATYLFLNLTPEDSPAALLEFMQLYIKSRKGVLGWEQLPELLQSAIFAQIPPVKS